MHKRFKHRKSYGIRHFGHTHRDCQPVIAKRLTRARQLGLYMQTQVLHASSYYARKLGDCRCKLESRDSICASDLEVADVRHTQRLYM